LYFLDIAVQKLPCGGKKDKQRVLAKREKKREDKGMWEDKIKDRKR